MKVSVSVMAHPDREHMVSALWKKLGRITPVAWDDEGEPSRDHDRVWRTARKAWMLHDPSADWHLLLQDDAVPADGLLEELPRALAHVPDWCIVSLYAGSRRPMSMMWNQVATEADKVGASWVVGSRALWGVALAIPTGSILEMVSYGDKQRGIPDDMRVGKWGALRKLETWYTWPSLVNHPEGKSLVGHGEGRTARAFRGDATGAQWNGPVVRWQR